MCVVTIRYFGTASVGFGRASCTGLFETCTSGSTLSLLTQAIVGALRFLAETTGNHYPGLQVAARQQRHTLPRIMANQTARIDIASSLARHVAPASVRAFLRRPGGGGCMDEVSKETSTAKSESFGRELIARSSEEESVHVNK